MDRQLKKRIMRSIIQNADQMVVVFNTGEMRLMSSLPVRSVFRLMRSMLGVRAIHGILPPRGKPLPVIYAPGVQ